MLSDLYPLLRTVEPAELNMTLNALATALEGRGDQIGQNLETVDSYLKRLNPQIPALVEDLRLTASVSDTYADVLPQVGDILHNTVTTTGTLETREARLHALLDDVTQFSGTARTFLDDNGDNLIRLGEVEPGPAAGAGALLDRVPVPARRHRQRRQARRPRRSAASRCTSCSRPCRTSRAATPPPTSRVLGEDRGPTCLHLPNPPWNQSNPRPPPARLRRRRRHADRQGHRPGRHGVRRRRRERRPAGRLRRLRRLARGVRPARRPCSPRRWAPPPTRCPTSAACCSARWSAAPPSRSARAGVTRREAPRQEDHAATSPSCSSSWS